MERNNPTEEYYNKLNGSLVIGVDFDNTCVIDEWPYVGASVPGATEVLKEIIKNGHELILFTQRTANYPECCPELAVYADTFGYNEDGTVDLLTPALEWFEQNVGQEIFDVNKNGLWEEMCDDHGRKIFMDLLIDDHNVGMEFEEAINRFGAECRIVDWKFVDQWLVERGVYPNRVLLNYDK